MVDKSIFQEFQIDELEIEQQIQSALGTTGESDLLAVIDKTVSNFEPGSILTGKIVNHIGDDVMVEVGLKSEGTISSSEFDDQDEIGIGDTVEVFLEAVESDSGLIILSKRKADRIRGWERIINNYKEGDTIKGKVIRRIKGGLLVDVGVPVFLPASQVDIRRPGDISFFIGREVEASILKIDQERRNIVISRRKLLEETRANAKSNLMAEIETGQIRKGVVKNIADFGAFVDLGGLDGLLHITDMSWTKRINHPSEILSVGQDIDIVVLQVSPAKQEISLGIKQLSENPWTHVANKYPPGSIVDGRVRNLANYGAFIEIEEGIDGLLHVSDMSWTKKIGHPGELLKKADDIKCIVLAVDTDKQRVALGLKQMTEDPWVRAIPDKYLPGQIVKGKVTKLTNFGVFVELEPDLEGLLHVSELSDDKVEAPQDIVKAGQELEVKILRVDTDDRKIGLSLKRAQWAAEDAGEEQGPVAPQRGGLDGAAHIGVDFIDNSVLQRHVQPVTVPTPETPDETAPESETSEPLQTDTIEISKESEVADTAEPPQDETTEVPAEPEVANLDTPPLDTEEQEAPKMDTAELEAAQTDISEPEAAEPTDNVLPDSTPAEAGADDETKTAADDPPVELPDFPVDQQEEVVDTSETPTEDQPETKTDG